MNNILIIKIYMSDDNAEWLEISGEYIKTLTEFRAKAATYGLDVHVAIIPTRSVFCCFAEVESDKVLSEEKDEINALIRKLTEDYTTKNGNREVKPSDVSIVYRQISLY